MKESPVPTMGKGVDGPNGRDGWGRIKMEGQMLESLECLAGLLLFFAGFILFGLLIEHCYQLILRRIDKNGIHQEIAEFLEVERMKNHE